MNTGSGDTLSVAADTLNIPVRQEEFSIGRIIPVKSLTVDEAFSPGNTSARRTDYAAVISRIDGVPMPRETINTDVSFILLSLSLLIITLISVFGRRSMIIGLSSISFRRRDEIAPPGTSEVFSWPPILRNIFTVLNISLFASIFLLHGRYLIPGLFGGSAGLVAALAGIMLAAILIRHLTCILLAEITGLKTLFREYMTIIYNSWFACAIILFVLNLIILFTPLNNPHPLIILGLILIFITLVVRTLRFLVIFTDRHISVFYFILYLCALEVLPALIILKLLGVF